MPIYEYKCKTCDHRMEKLQRMSDDPLTDCPLCEKSALIKLVSAASFKLKGTGWYETDFKNNGKKPDTKDAAKDQPAKAESSKKESSKAESSKTSPSKTAPSQSKSSTSRKKS